MGHRTLALLTLVAALTIAGFLLHDREREEAPAESGSPTAPAEVEPTIEFAAVEPARAPLGRAEAHPPEPSARSKLPVHPHEEAQPALELPALEVVDTVLVFRALDQAGQPVLGELSVSTKISSRRHHSSRDSSAPTDGEGRFEVRIEPSLLEDDRRELEIGARERTLMARVDLSRSFPPGRTDMGGVVLTPAPLIAEGRVIDAAGRPVAGASIMAHTLASRDGEIEPYFGEVKTAEDGTFALYGSTDASRIETVLRHELLRAAALELPVGSRGIEILAQESGGVTGQVLVDPGVPVRGLRMILRPENVPPGTKMESFHSSTTSERKEIDRDGSFQLEGLLPWLYTFTVATERDVLVEIPGIEIVSGEITRDLRLQALDLRGRLHLFTLDLVRPAPSFELSGSVLYRESGTSTPVRRHYFRGSTVVVVTPLAAIDAMVRVIDCRIERLSDLAERTELHLRPGIPVRLALPQGVALPAPPLFVGAELVTADERPEERARGYSEVRATPPFDEHGETVCQACESGRMTVRWFVERRDRGGGGSRGPLDMPFEQIVVVEDREDEQRIELVLTQQALAAALAAR